LSRLRAGLLITGFLGLTLSLMPVQQVLLWTAPRYARRLPHHYHRWLARLLGFRVTVDGQPLVRGPALLVSNHVSWIDIVVLSSVVSVSFIAKREVGTWPLFGTMARLQQTVFIDRTKKQRTGASLDDIKQRLARGDALVLFPEGTSHDGINMMPFKSSYFGAANDPALKVVPVTLAYASVNGLPMTRRQRPAFAWYGEMGLPGHLWDALKAGPIGVTIRFHPQVRLDDFAGRKDLARFTESQVRESLAHLSSGR
jgi:lyso-ornithine lipid O-acyltransferase